jgi:hypothetical protein
MQVHASFDEAALSAMLEALAGGSAPGATGSSGESGESGGDGMLFEALEEALVPEVDGLPGTVLVICAGVPDRTQDVAKLLQAAAGGLVQPGDLRVLFAQIGGDKAAAEWLQQMRLGLLDDGAWRFGMLEVAPAPPAAEDAAEGAAEEGGDEVGDVGGGSLTFAQRTAVLTLQPAALADDASLDSFASFGSLAFSVTSGAETTTGVKFLMALSRGDTTGDDDGNAPTLPREAAGAEQ